ncbi:hypothetical protein [Desulfovibrio psychrotolerans]|uniref:Uncharacterized protein n=1 Tax=Desulfovibrio psychrotolerans TaxID=415242 RepID=A0A7J0BWZ8_9BACT|nr:hypothetical protein [Desulfovibrio psychrotolerans]GFM38239.1 hypothetical protein DSM19430T_29230 [Desulfovibrio psychrotolerans]
MKIRSEQLDALLQQEELKKRPKAAEGFGDLFAQELERQEGASAAQGAVPPVGARAMVLNPLLMANPVEETGAVQGADEAAEVAGRLDGMLDKWEHYSRQIGAAGEADLKGAHGTLEAISGELSQLKEQNPDLADRYPGLGLVVNELEVMSFTERFKLNRGDYV